MNALIWVLGFLVLVILLLVSILCDSWWVLITGLGIAALIGAVFGCFAIQEAFRRWTAATPDWKNKLGMTVVVLFIITAILLGVGIPARKYAGNKPCWLGGCSTTTLTPADTTFFTNVATPGNPVVVKTVIGERLCWPAGIENAVSIRKIQSGDTATYTFAVKEGVSEARISFREYPTPTS